ncbi:MAG TPA: LPXTG cell wall anchor domain-containing protein [Pseudonocardiaceae bacterium]|nr:LPXTG cell wall anchor domain-containing protein [Pseudonocardiaceae bacterium]
MYKVPGAGGAVGAGAGTLAFTGADVTGWVMFGALLLVAGVLAILLGRRRRHRLAALGDDTIAS